MDACSCSTGEREQCRVQRLLMEGMKTIVDNPGWLKGESGAPEADPSRMEVYGHLVAALHPHMVEATDEQLETLISPRFLPTVLVAFYQPGAQLQWCFRHAAHQIKAGVAITHRMQALFSLPLAKCSCDTPHT